MSERVGLATLVERACLRWIDPTPEGPKHRVSLSEGTPRPAMRWAFGPVHIPANPRNFPGEAMPWTC
jgi:hypothetical protein